MKTEEKPDDSRSGEACNKLPRFHVTLPLLRQHRACFDGYNRVVRSLQGVPFTAEDRDSYRYLRFEHKEPVSLAFILESNGLDDALWALRCLKGHDRDIRLFAVWCARQVQQTDPRSIAALDIAERYAYGLASDSELAAAREAAEAVTWGFAVVHAGAAAWATTRVAAWDAVWTAAWHAPRAPQAEMFFRLVEGNAPWQESPEDREWPDAAKKGDGA